MVIPKGSPYRQGGLGMVNGYDVTTPHGIFRVLQSLTYGELLIAILLVVLITVVGVKFIWEVACREGWL
jgi:hypothetical protein